MDRETLFRAFRDLCLRRYEACDGSRRRCRGDRYDPKPRERVLAQLHAARTLGEVVAIMYAEGWNYRVLLSFLAESSVDDASGDEFDGLFPEERRKVLPKTVGPTPGSMALLGDLKGFFAGAGAGLLPGDRRRSFKDATRLGEAFRALREGGLPMEVVMRSVVEAQGATPLADEFGAWNDTVRFPLHVEYAPDRGAPPG